MKSDWQKGIEILKKGGVVVLPTDTLYGIIGSAFSKKVVERIYQIKGRSEGKPFIVLVTSYKDLEKFGIKINKEQLEFFKKIWPGQVSAILPCKNKKFEYIHQGLNSIAFRMISPRNENLYNLIKKVGPIVAPSVNPEGEKPAETIAGAKEYFGDKVDLYINVGTRKSPPSTLVRIVDDKIEILREGVKKIRL
jgi:L-threonylcarbamoyladenylate synthase